MCHASKERERLFGTRSADYIRASSHNGCIQRPNTWLHPNASPKCQIFPLHRRRRPYMAHRDHSLHCTTNDAIDRRLNRSTADKRWLGRCVARALMTDTVEKGLALIGEQ